MICFDASGVYVYRRKIKDGSRRSKLKVLRLILHRLGRKLFPNITCHGSRRSRPAVFPAMLFDTLLRLCSSTCSSMCFRILNFAPAPAHGFWIDLGPTFTSGLPCCPEDEDKIADKMRPDFPTVQHCGLSNFWIERKQKSPTN